MLTAVVVLPTPPFWFATQITRRWAGRGMVISPLGLRIRTARSASWASGGSSVSRETGEWVGDPLGPSSVGTVWAGTALDSAPALSPPTEDRATGASVTGGAMAGTATGG